MKVVPSRWNWHFRNREDHKRNKLESGLSQAEKRWGKKQEPGLNFLPFPLPHHTKIISLPQNKQTSGFWNTVFEKACFHAGVESICNIYTPWENDSPPAAARVPHAGPAAAPRSGRARFGRKVVELNLSPTQRSYHIQPTMFQPNSALLTMSAVRWQIRLFKLLRHIHPFRAGYPGNRSSTASGWEGESKSSFLQLGGKLILKRRVCFGMVNWKKNNLKIIIWRCILKCVVMRERTKQLSFKNTIMARFISENNEKYFKAFTGTVFCTLVHVSIKMLQTTWKISLQNLGAAANHLFVCLMLTKISNTRLAGFSCLTQAQ